MYYLVHSTLVELSTIPVDATMGIASPFCTDDQSGFSLLHELHRSHTRMPKALVDDSMSPA